MTPTTLLMTSRPRWMRLRRKLRQSTGGLMDSAPRWQAGAECLPFPETKGVDRRREEQCFSFTRQ